MSAAARALLAHTKLSAKEIVQNALNIAAEARQELLDSVAEAIESLLARPLKSEE